MGRLVAAARAVLQAQEASLRDLRERDAVATAANQLRRLEPQLCEGFPTALLKAFSGSQGGKKAGALSVANVQFDQLELMDETQVQTSVTLARIQQSAMLAADGQLSELNTLMCSLQGLGMVRAEYNPLRPEVYIEALKEVVEQTQLAHSVQLLWFNAMAASLGPELRSLYTQLCKQLRQEGVKPVAFAVTQGFGNHGGAAGPAAVLAPALAAQPLPTRAAMQGQPIFADSTLPAPIAVKGRDEVLLTLDKLRKLMAGELGPAGGKNASSPGAGGNKGGPDRSAAAPGSAGGSRIAQFAAQFSEQFEDGVDRSAQGPVTDFDSTVPAALEALTEMKQVDRVMQSLEQRRGAAQTPGALPANTIEAQRLALRQSAHDVAQTLSLEVVTLMVDNMARDPRLLEPVGRAIRNLEPALLRLVLVDPRFFTDKQHPARRLLHEITHRSLAFESSEVTGFDSFMRSVDEAVAPLSQAAIENGEVFEAKLSTLRKQWDQEARATVKERERAVDVLQHAEARNLLAAKIARDIENHPDSAKVPAVVTDFLCGPWAQVVAQARIKQGAGSAEAERFEALVPALLWSAHPELARASPSRLTRAVPRLLATLREGLETIHYPVTRTSAFLEALMAIHQAVFRSNAAPSPAEQADVPATVPGPATHTRAQEEDDPWIAPEEARASNFVDLQETPGDPPPADAPLLPDLVVPPSTAMSSEDFVLGCWVEMWVQGEWVRTQLTWASPHGTLFLFTGVFGTTQSMTRRSRDKLLAMGRLRLVSGQGVDEGALNAVAQTAMRNSVDGLDSMV